MSSVTLAQYQLMHSLVPRPLLSFLLLSVRLSKRAWYILVNQKVHDTVFFTVGLASTKHGQSNNAGAHSLAANFTSEVGTCTGIVEPFKHLLRATAHPRFLVFEQ